MQKSITYGGRQIARLSDVNVCVFGLLALLIAPAWTAELKSPVASYRMQARPDQVGQLNSNHDLTLDQALDLAENYNPVLKGAIAQREGAEAGIVTARAYPNPEARIMGGQQFRRPIATPGVPGILQHYSAAQLIELPSLRRTRISAAESNFESSEFGLAGVRRSVRTAVKHAFYDVLKRKEEIAHAEENLRLVVDLRRRTEVQVNVGEAAKLELTRAEAEIAKAQAVVKRARLEYIAAMSALRAAVSAPLAPDVDPVGELDPPITLPSLESLRADVLSHHPALAQARAEVERANALLANEKAQRLPQPAFTGEFENQPDLRFYRMGVSIPVPLWNRREGPIAEASAAIRQATAMRSERILEITAALERAYGMYQVANQQVVSFEAGALRQAQSAVEAAQAAFRFGERGIIEVLDAQRVLQTVRGDFLDAQYERQAALVDLEELGAIDLKGKK